MKKFNWLLVMLSFALVPALQSCDDDGYSIGNIGQDWATVCTIGGGGYYLGGDHRGMIGPVASSISRYKPVSGERVVVFFNPLVNTGKGVQVKIEGIQEVSTKEMENVTVENEEEFGNDPIVIYQGDTRLGGKFLNIIFHQHLPRSEKHRISLVQNKIELEASETPKALNANGDRYMHLELRYNTYDDVIGYRGQGRVSYNLEEFYPAAEDAVGTGFKGFKVTISSRENGEGKVIVLDLDHPVGAPEKARDVYFTPFVK